jgi:CheY-like chemotaxis protein
VPSVVDVSNKLFLLTVWSENDDEPDQILYEDDVFNPRNPIYPTGDEQFVTYYFLDTIKVPVNTSFFVGWRQLDPERLNLGLDRNLDFSSKIKFSVNVGATWLTSPFSGTAMIRPVFSTKLDQFIGINDPLRAIAILLARKPELIFLDLVMPNANGYEICGQLRRLSIFKHTPIVILTGNDGIVDRVRAKMVGSTDFLGKPVNPDQVLSTILKYIKQDEPV